MEILLGLAVSLGARWTRGRAFDTFLTSRRFRAFVRVAVRSTVMSIVAVGPQGCTDSRHDPSRSDTASPAVVQYPVGALVDSIEKALAEREQELQRMRERAWRGPPVDPEAAYRRARAAGLPVARPSPMQMDSARRAGRSEFMRARSMMFALDRPLLPPSSEPERARICRHFGADILAQYDSTRKALFAVKIVLPRILGTIDYERKFPDSVKERHSVALQEASTALRQLRADVRRRAEQQPQLRIDALECTER